MEKLLVKLPIVLCIPFLVASQSCQEKPTDRSKAVITEMDLKRGELITCGPPDKEFGSVTFENSCGEAEDMNLAMALLHSFEYDEAEKVFANIMDKQPACTMAYWGIAMSNFHPLWAPPSEPELRKGAKAIEIARSIPSKSKREQAYMDAIAAFYTDWEKTDHRSRCLKFEKAMEALHINYPADKEAAAFYALSLIAAADPADKSFSKQKRAGAMLTALYPKDPTHPGIVHYIIHTYDSPELAELALPAARQYASVAPSSAHALHMPSHIFTRLGLWDECIQSNIAAVSAARCYAEGAGIKGHWDEELHGLDYLMYAYLQKGENRLANEQLAYLKTIQEVSPVNFKVAYAFAAIPARYVLENKLWQQAANLPFDQANFSWKDYPWQKAIIHFARLLGNVHIGNIDAANVELQELNRIQEILLEQNDAYKVNQVQIQIKASQAWIRFNEGNLGDAEQLMNLAADMEDQTEKHPVTPGEVIPARELLADLYLQMNKPDKALAAYEASLKKHANRFNGLYGAGLAAEKARKPAKADLYYRKLMGIVNPATSSRPEIMATKQFLKAL